MQEQNTKPKNPFLLRFSNEQNQKRHKSFNRLNFAEDARRDGTYVAKKDILEHELFEHHIVKSNMQIQSSLRRLHATFIHEKVPEFYVYFFMNQIIHATEEKIEDNIQKQTQELKGKRSYYHVIKNSIKAREGCLKQLHKCLDNLFNNEDDNLTKHVFREQIVHYRKLTAFVIGHIRGWKEYLVSISPQIQYISYQYRGEDYLIKLLNDCEFIFNSFLTKHLKFSFKNDPYIMRPYADGRQSKFLQIFKYDETERGMYMVDMNYLADQRAKYLSTKINSRQDKIKEIEKIYNHKQNPLNSRIIIRKINLSERKPERQEEKEQAKSKVLSNNFVQDVKDVKDEKRSKYDEIDKKTQKIKRIKEIFGKTSDPYQKKIINDKMFPKFSESSIGSPYKKFQKFGQFQAKKQKTSNLNYESDFEKLVRKKQVEVLENRTSISSKRTMKTARLTDSLSETRKILTKDEEIQELQNVLNHLETFSPQKMDKFKTKKKQNELQVQEIRKGLNLPPQHPKTLLEHNEEVYVKIRNEVIDEIERDKLEKERIERKRREQNEKIQQILKQKIKSESLEAIQNSRVRKVVGKEELANEMGSPELFGYKKENEKKSQKMDELQQELKKQMELKWLREVQDELRRKQRKYQLDETRKKDEERQEKQLKKIEEKRQLEKKYEEIEREERAIAVKKQIELDEERKKEIEEEMKEIIQKQKNTMEEFAIKQRKEVEESMRESIKLTLLATLKNQKDKFYDNEKKKEEMKKAEKSYREEMKTKLQAQYQLEQKMKDNRDKEQKTAKLRLIKEKLKEFDTKNQNEKKKSAVKQEMKDPQIKQKKMDESKVTDFPEFRESLLPKNKSQQNEKKKLREQFQCELFAFRKPEAFEPINKEQEEEKNFIIKDFRSLIDKEVDEKTSFKEKQKSQQLEQSKLSESPIKKMKLEEIKEEEEVLSKKQSKPFTLKKIQEENQDKFVRFSEKSSQGSFNEDEAIRIKLGMTLDEYQIYKKKKDAISLKRDIQNQKKRKEESEKKKQVVRVIDSFQKMQLRKQKEIKEESQEDISSLDQQRKSPSQEGKYEQKQSETQKQEKKQEKQRKLEEEREKKKQKQRQIEQIGIITANSRISSRVEKRFMTSDEEQEEQVFSKPKRKSPRKKESRQSGYNFKKKPIKSKVEQKIQVVEEFQPIKEIKNKKTFTKIRQIPLSHLQEFLNDHFENLPKVIKKLNIYKKSELQKFILQQESFNIIEYVKESISVGMIILSYNSNKTKYRSINIDHIGSYDEDELLDLLVNVVKFVFKIDPCQQITLSLIYDKELSYQADFMKKFEVKFDPYGSIFQKKIFNTQFERKFVFRRNIGEDCQNQAIAPFNRGNIQLSMDFFMGEKSLSDHAQYPLLGYDIGCYGMLANYLSAHCEDDKFAQIITNSTESDSIKDKKLGHLAKLSLTLKKDESYLRFSQIKEEQFIDVMSMNLELNTRGLKLVPYPPEDVEEPNALLWQNFEQSIPLSYEFYNAITKISIDETDYECKYLRYVPNKKNKMFTIKSSVYSSKVHILPTKHNKYKIFVLDSEEYDNLKDPIPLDIYLRLLFANVQTHQISNFQTIWLPELKGEGRYFVEEMSEFGERNTVMRTHINFSFTDYLGNSLKVSPTHRDLLVTAPFILGIMNMQIEKVHEGSPIYIQRMGKENMRWLKQIVVKEQSD